MRILSNNWESVVEEHSRLQAPFFFKIKFNAPSRFKERTKQNQSKNAAHAEYIATRPGVENAEAELSREKEQAFEERVYNTIVGKEGVSPAAPDGHAQYIHERPRSFGLFSTSDAKPDLRQVQNELLEHRGVVWRMVLSLTEEDAKRLDFVDRKSWEVALRASMPDAAAAMGIGETNLRWVAAFHQEQGHPHVHVIMWEDEPTRRRGRLNETERIEVRKKFMDVIYAEERTRLYQEKTVTRDLLREISKKELVNAVDFVRELRKLHLEVDFDLESVGAGKDRIPAKLQNKDAQAIAQKLTRLGEMMPDKGRIAYKLMPEPVKQAVDETTKWLLEHPAFYENLRRYYSAVEAMAKQYSFQDAKIQQAIEKARNDIEKRISQVVLRAAAEAKKDIYMIVDPQRAEAFIQKFAHAVGRPVDHLAEKVIEKVVTNLRDFGFNQHEQLRILSIWSTHAEIKQSIEQLKAIVDRVNSVPPSPDVSLEQAGQNIANVLKLSGESAERIAERLRLAGLQDGTVEKIMDEAVKIEKQTGAGFMNENQWQIFNRNMGTDAPYPWELKEHTIVVPDHLQEIKHAFATKPFLAHEGDSPGYIAYCMTVALKQMGTTPDERREIMYSFVRNAPDVGIERILDSIDQAETNYLRQGTWNRICASLGVELPYPWVTEEVMELDSKKYKEALEQFRATTHPLQDEELVKATAEQYAKYLRYEWTDVEAIRNEIIQWGERTGNLKQEHIEQLDLFKKRTDDLNVLARHFGITDPVQKTVADLTKVLVAAGLDSDAVGQLIRDWNVRSGANIEEDKLTKMISTAERGSREMLSWGRPPVISKGDFEKLCTNLGIQANYIWQRNGQQQESSINWAKQLWKSAWQAIDREQQRTHAQGELLKKQLQRQRELSAKREQGDD